jgi:hypothetical protein
VINPTEAELLARIPEIKKSAVDALDGEVIDAQREGLSLRVPRRSVRMLELSPA